MLPMGLDDVKGQSGERRADTQGPACPYVQVDTGEGLLLPYLELLVHVAPAAGHCRGSFPARKFDDQGLGREHQRCDRCSILEC